MVVCLERGASLHMAQLMPLPLSVSCFGEIQIGFTFLVPAHLGSPGKGPLNRCVCVLSINANLHKKVKCLPVLCYNALTIQRLSCTDQKNYSEHSLQISKQIRNSKLWEHQNMNNTNSHFHTIILWIINVIYCSLSIVWYFSLKKTNSHKLLLPHKQTVYIFCVGVTK